jgi:thiol-disulfide isomerase/thioredoxin/tetratricopeptide (TPR) repeat protein
MLATAASADETLKEGSPAPPMKVVKWFKGTPVSTFEKGKIYVVEFWATWCGPCKISIPHLTELAKKYNGKVIFTGVDCWENPAGGNSAYLDTVAKFVSDMGDKMSYNIAADGPEGTMATTWMTAAGQNGIPTAFVVDKEGRIAWIGHPMGGLDEALGQIIAGKFDVAAAARKRVAETTANNALQTVYQLWGLGKTKEAIAAVDKLIADHPDQRTPMLQIKFQILWASDQPAAIQLARTLSRPEAKCNAALLNEMALSIVFVRGNPRSADCDLALAMARRAADLTFRADPNILGTLACAYYKKGNKTFGLAAERKAMAAYDRKAADNPNERASLRSMEFRLLMSADQPAAVRLARRLSTTEFRNDPATLYQMARSLAAVEKGDDDLALAMAMRAAELTKEADLNVLDTLAIIYTKKGDTDSAKATKRKAIAAIDKMIADEPAQRAALIREKFVRLSADDPAAAVQLAKSLSQSDLKDSAVLLNEMAWAMVDPNGSFKNPDYDLALTMAKHAAELTKEADPYILDTLAYAYFWKGDRDSAIATERKAIALLDKGQYSPSMKKGLNDNLKHFTGGS